MKAHFVAVLCVALAPAAAFALSDYLDEYVDEVTDELEEWGIPVGGETDQPAAPDQPEAPDGATPPESPAMFSMQVDRTGTPRVALTITF